MTTCGETVVWPGFVSLVVPAKWTHSEDEGVISLFDETSGVGVLQISFARRTHRADPTEEEARGLAESFCQQRGWQPERARIRTTSVANSPAAKLTFCDGQGAFWEVWQVVESRRAMTITYTCDAADSAIEEPERLAIVDSLCWQKAE